MAEINDNEQMDLKAMEIANLTYQEFMGQCRASDKTAYGAAQREPISIPTELVEMGFNAYQDRCVALALPQADYRAVGTQRDGVGIKIASPELDWIYPALGLCGEAGEVAEKLKKVLRDDKGVMTEETKEAVKKELGDVQWYVAYLAHKLGFTLQEVAEANLKKLYARETKGTRRGSGDDR